MTQLSFSVPHYTACFRPALDSVFLEPITIAELIENNQFFDLYPAGVDIKILAHGLRKT
jgi:hypothetical protein